MVPMLTVLLLDTRKRLTTVLGESTFFDGGGAGGPAAVDDSAWGAMYVCVSLDLSSLLSSQKALNY